LFYGKEYGDVVWCEELKMVLIVRDMEIVQGEEGQPRTYVVRLKIG